MRDQLILAGFATGIPVLLAAITLVLRRKYGSDPLVQIVASVFVGGLTMPFLGV